MTHDTIITLENTRKISQNKIDKDPLTVHYSSQKMRLQNLFFLECDYARSIWDDAKNEEWKVKTLYYAWCNLFLHLKNYNLGSLHLKPNLTIIWVDLPK